MDSLSHWFTKIARPLPWRKTHDPYRIWVSEVMLQQTQVETVLAYYDRFLAKFPTLESLANSDEQDVLTLWSGLGYYRRAKNLRFGAKYLLERGGKFPKTKDEILNVPGIGPYTAGAILSIAFDLPEPLVDGNVNRVFARYFGVQDPIQSSKVQKHFWKMAKKWVESSQSPRIHNQALMELGSLVCKKGTPLCHQCPIQKGCVAYKKGWQLKLPISKPRKEAKEIHWIGLLLQKKRKGSKPLYFVSQNINTDWWEGLWDFPKLEKPIKLKWEHTTKILKQKLGQDIELLALNYAQHNVTHHKITVAPFIVDKAKHLPKTTSGKWLSTEEIAQLPLSSLAKKIFRQIPMC